MPILEAGMPAPDFELADQDEKTWRLSELAGKKVILFFYPGDDTPGCTREACDFRDSSELWAQAGYIVLGISPQDRNSKRAFATKFGLGFPLLADVDRTVESGYGTALDEGYDYEGIRMTTKRSTFVIDEQGLIEHAFYGVSSRDHVEGLKELLGVS